MVLRVRSPVGRRARGKSESGTTPRRNSTARARPRDKISPTTKNSGARPSPRAPTTSARPRASLPPSAQACCPCSISNTCQRVTSTLNLRPCPCKLAGTPCTGGTCRSGKCRNKGMRLGDRKEPSVRDCFAARTVRGPVPPRAVQAAQERAAARVTAAAAAPPAPGLRVGTALARANTKAQAARAAAAALDRDRELVRGREGRPRAEVAAGAGAATAARAAWALE